MGITFNILGTIARKYIVKIDAYKYVTNVTSEVFSVIKSLEIVT